MPHPAADRGSATVAVATAAALQLLLLAAVVGAVGGSPGRKPPPAPPSPPPAAPPPPSPGDHLAEFKAAGTEYGIPWTVLAALGEVESGDGQDDGRSSAAPWPDAVALHLVALRRRRRHNGPPTPSPPPPAC